MIFDAIITIILVNSNHYLTKGCFCTMEIVFCHYFSSTNHGNNIHIVLDGSYIVVGDHRSRFITGNQQGMIMKLKANGNIEWSKLFGGSNESRFKDRNCSNVSY